MIKTTKQSCDFERRFTFIWIHKLRHSFNISALFRVHLTNYVDWRGTTLFLNICVIRRIRQIQCDNFPDVLYAVKCKYKGKSFVGFIPLSYDFTVRMCTVLYVDKMIIIMNVLTHYRIPVLYKPSKTWESLLHLKIHSTRLR